MIPLVPLALGLAEFVPTIAKWVAGEKAADVAEQVIGVAKAVTGLDDSEGAVAAIKGDPKLQAELQRAWMAQEVSLYQAETERLAVVNKTIQQEALSADPFVKRWRPFLGYCVGVTWAVQMNSAAWVMVTDPDKAPQILAAMGALTTMWAMALGVLGVSVTQRSKDKQIAAGKLPGPGLLAALAKRLGGKS